MRRVLFSTAVISATVFASVLAGQSRDRTTRSSECGDRGGWNREVYCETREETLNGAKPLDGDTGGNGGVTIRGWHRGGILMRARIVARADTDAEARRIATGARIEAAGATIRADGPRNDRHNNW